MNLIAALNGPQTPPSTASASRTGSRSRAYSCAWWAPSSSAPREPSSAPSPPDHTTTRHSPSTSTERKETL